MSTSDERALTRMLSALVAEPVVPQGLSERVERGYRRRRLAVAGAAAAAVLVTAAAAGVVGAGGRDAHVPPARPAPAPPTSNAEILHGRFVFPVTFVDGALFITPAPPGEDAAISESEAVARFRTSSGGSLVRAVRVAFGRVTLRVDLRAGRAAAFFYRERGTARCFRRVEPAVAVAYQSLSLPWRQAGRTGNATIVRFTPGACEIYGGYDETILTDPPRRELTIGAVRAIQSAPCSSQSPQHTRQLRIAPGATLVPAAVGSVTLVYTGRDPDRFVYDDGSG